MVGMIVIVENVYVNIDDSFIFGPFMIGEICIYIILAWRDEEGDY